MLSLRPIHSVISRSWFWLICFCLLTTSALQAQTLKLLWTADLGHRIQSSPALGLDGTVYIGTDDGFIHALKPDGTIAWTSRSEAAVVTTPAVDALGNIYFGSMDKLFYAVNPDGRGKWFTSLRAEIASSAAINDEGDTIITTTQGVLVCLNPSGNERWRYTINEPIVSSPAIGAEGIIYFGGQAGNLYALRRNGSLFWQQNLGERINASPAIAPDGTVYIATVTGKVVAASPAGTILWEKNFNSAVRSSPVLTPAGHLLFGTDEGKLFCLSKDGDIVWSSQLPDADAAIRSTPAVTQDGTIVFGSYSGSLYGVSAATGKQLWSQKTGDKISGSPLILPNGTILIGSWDGKVYAYAGTAGPATNTWSTFRGNAQRTGKATLAGPPAELRLSLSPAMPILPAPASVNIQVETLAVIETPTAVRLLINGKQFSQLNAAPFAWTWQETNAGTYLFVAEATFPSRPVLLSATQTVTLQPASMTSDTVKPKLEIKAPASNARVLIPQLTLSGTAEDNLSLARVEYQLNSNAWQTANGTTNWTIPISLAAGENNILVRAVDAAGNYSSEEKRSFRRLVMTPLSFSILGEGSVKPNLQREELEVGNTYTLTAEPVEGWLFTGWTGSLTNNSAKLSFVMQTNMSLRAEFKPNPFKVIAGDFHGLIFQTNTVSADYCGHFTLTTSERGAFKVRLILGGVTHNLSGQFDADGQASAVILNERQQALSIKFNLNWLKTPDLITGSLYTEGGTAELLGDRRAFDGKEKRTPYAGNYTLSLSLPADVNGPTGSGYALVQVTEDGRIQMKGRLKDGTNIEQTSQISPEGLWPLYVAPYGNRGLLTGWLRFGNESFADLHGSLHWVRPSTTGTNANALGFQRTLTAIGSKYATPARKQTVLGWSDGLLGLQGGGLPDLIAFKLQLKENHDAVLPEVQPEILNLKINAENGLFTGQFIHPDHEKPVPMEGVLLQKQNYGTGFFLTPKGNGSVFISPAK
ncbi:MAG: PQQ-binding-like beta-propeller repeat protein [Verrucomicrobiota bacterium]